MRDRPIVWKVRQKYLHLSYPVAREYKSRYSSHSSFLNSHPNSPNMSTSLESISTPAEAGEAPSIVDGFGESLIAYAFAVVVLAAAVLTRFEDGRKAIQRLVWLLDGVLGGAPHTVALPGPPGLPVVGNLMQVSRP